MIGAVVLALRFIAGLYYATTPKPWFGEATILTLFMIVLLAFGVFLIILHCLSVGVCNL